MKQIIQFFLEGESWESDFKITHFMCHVLLKHIKGTLMQIWKTYYMFVFILTYIFFLNVCKQTFHIYHARISWKVKVVLMWNLQHFHIKTKILVDLHICISVPLILLTFQPTQYILRFNEIKRKIYVRSCEWFFILIGMNYVTNMHSWWIIYRT